MNQEKWASIIATQQSSGKNQKSWCLENEVNIHNFVYWKKRLADKPSSEKSQEPLEQFEWANVVVAEASSDIVIEVGSVRIHLKSNFDEHLLKKLIRTLQAI